MELKKSKTTFFILIAFLASLITASVSAISISYAAYRNYIQYDEQLDSYINYKKYFAGGDGTATSPFQLTGPTHFRNLQKLTAYGVFDDKTYFETPYGSSDFTWSGDPLLPIGTDDNPFEGHYDGNGIRITNLVVQGNNSADIGMFGYTGFNSSVKNIRLIDATVNVGANDAGGQVSSINPLDAIITGNQSTGSSNLAKNLTASLTSNSQGISIAAAGVTAIENLGFTVKFRSTDTAFLTDAGNLTTAGATSSDSDRYAQYIAYIQAEYNDMLISYTLERWIVEVDRNTTVIVADTNKQLPKTMYPIVSVTDDSGATTSTQQIHETYVGLFIGHCDGSAQYLGTVRGKIIATGRPSRALDLLIGRQRSDNPLDNSGSNYYYKYLDLADYLSTHHPTSSTDYAWKNASGTATTTYAAYQNGNQANNDGYNAYTSLSTAIGLDPQTSITSTTNYANSATMKDQDYFRAYGKMTIPSTKQNYSAMDSSGNVSTESAYALQLKDNVAVGVGDSQSILITLGYKNFYVANGFWFWSTTTLGGFWNRIFGSYNGSFNFDVSFNLWYSVVNADSDDNFVIYTNNFNAAAKASFIATVYPRVESSSWSTISTYNTPTSVLPQASDFDVIPPGGLPQNIYQKRSVSFTSTGGSDGTWGSILSGSYSRTPMFAFGLRGVSASQSFALNIFRIEIMVSSSAGNASALISNVDYLYNNTATYSSSKEWTGWPNSSRTKVQYKMLADLSSMTTNNLTINMDRSTGSSHTVQINYTTGDNNWTVFNTGGYSQATITKN